MSEHTYLKEDEMIRRAVEALLRDLGPVEATRFLTLPQRRKVDSVTRHRLWQEGLDRDCFFDQVFEAKRPNADGC
jgi:hypothetical protein